MGGALNPVKNMMSNPLGMLKSSMNPMPGAGLRAAFANPSAGRSPISSPGGTSSVPGAVGALAGGMGGFTPDMAPPNMQRMIQNMSGLMGGGMPPGGNTGFAGPGPDMGAIAQSLGGAGGAQPGAFGQIAQQMGRQQGPAQQDPRNRRARMMGG